MNNEDSCMQYIQKLPKNELPKLIELYEKHLQIVEDRSSRWRNDEEYREKRLNSMKKYSKKRYENDDDYRGKKKQQAKERYYKLKNNCSIDSLDNSSNASTPTPSSNCDSPSIQEKLSDCVSDDNKKPVKFVN